MNGHEHTVLSYGRAKFSASFSAVAIFVYLLPVAFALSIFRGGTGSSSGLLLLVWGYITTSSLAAAAIALARPPRLFVLLPVVIALAVPTIAVTIRGAWGNLYWYVDFIRYLPGGLLIAAQVALFIRFFSVGDRGAVIALASSAIAGSAVAPILTFPLVAEWEFWYYPATALVLVSLGSNIGVALWLRGARQRAGPPLSREE